MPQELPPNTTPTPKTKRQKLKLPIGVTMNFWSPNTRKQDDFAHWWWLGGLATMSVFLIMQVAGGVLRWVLDMIHLAPLTYVPNLMILSVIFSLLLNDLYNRRTHAGLLWFLALVGLAFCVGVFSTPRIVQPIFAVWVMVPFFFGLAFAPVAVSDFPYKNKALFVLFLLCAGGVIVHNAVAFPWVGISYEVNGIEVAGAKDWSTGGKQRLSGLARSSYDVAGQMLIFASLVALSTKKGIYRIIIWAASTYAISLSTSKGVFLSLLMVIVSVEFLIRRQVFLLRMVFLVGMVWLFVPPIMGWTMDWSELYRTKLDNPLYGSFIDRMHDMWPRALALATEHGYAFFGRGLGGLGVPLSMFEPALFNAGDNLFVFLLVEMGVFAIPITLVGFIVLFKLCAFIDSPQIRQILLMAVAVNWYGGVSNIMEHAVMAMTFGMVCRAVASYIAGNTFREPLLLNK